MWCVVGNHRASQCKHRGRERDWKQVADPLIAMFHSTVCQNYNLCAGVSKLLLGWNEGMVNGVNYEMDHGIFRNISKNIFP